MLGEGEEGMGDGELLVKGGSSDLWANSVSTDPSMAS